MALGTTLGILASITSTPGFSNIYSLDFDGVDDYVNIGNGINFEYNNAFSYSFWVKPNIVSGVKYLFSKYTGGRGILMYYNSSGAATPAAISFNLYNTNAGSTATRKRITTATGNILTKGVWSNIVITYDGSGLGSGIKLYKNGVSQTVTVTQDNLQNQTIVVSQDAYISGNNFASSFLSGKQDEFAIFNTELSSADALTIYGVGQPTDLTDLSPLAWYRMGDNGAYKSPQWLLPNNENKDKVSNYSFDFDGVDDYISVSDNSIGQTQNISYSIWVNLNVTTRQYIIGNQNSSNGGCGLQIESGDVLVFQMADGGNDSFFNSRVASFSTYAPINTWNHILATWDGTDSKIYINGVLRNTWSPTLPYTISGYDTTFNIGWRAAGFAQMTNGKLDELALFDSAVSIGDVWDGSGQPIDVSAVSGITNNWRMGEEATFSTNWTIPDQVGSNDGTSANMTIEDRVGSAPSSSNNAVSFNMDLIDRVEDTPI